MMNVKINNGFSNIAPPSYDELMKDPNKDQQKSREEKFREIVDKYEISIDFAQRLQQLSGFIVVFIFDDSGSMQIKNRFDDLKYFAKIAIEIISLFDPEGASVYFLNKEPSPIHNVKTEQQLDDLFDFRPQGSTPLNRVLNTVLKNNEAMLDERKLLILMATDGEPTDDKGNSAIEEFEKLLKERSQRVYTTIVACTDNRDSVEYLNG